MKLIIAGSRTMDFPPKTIEGLVAAFDLVPTEIVCGDCRGIDWAGRDWAVLQSLPIKYMPADWNKDGRAAGPLRNKRMAQYADELLLVWDGHSKGSLNMRHEMLKLRKVVHEVVLNTLPNNT